MKVLILAAILSSVYAGLLPTAALGYARPYGLTLASPLVLARPAYARVGSPVEDYDPNPQYTYAYDIQDPLTGDSKSQHETRSGDVVQGAYSLIDPDGTRRIVEYTADPQNGFTAVVHKQPLGAAVKELAPFTTLH